ncbi:MAG TPA: tRNA (adenosine(37)-N6)-threonylcarbamoyltransferase complex dimerization subunit type 1 TsaB [Rhodocyclaceae bacterium]|jgi:tRNA threonylcarbamoyladenosine biosynthesis protein TsaB|nr:tRNA (adenosine(37)-N6)-threonylcarbamoyltransferase complex dimerization subunit type 1 TsaB [Rhodocyclaceae bacterium]
MRVNLLALETSTHHLSAALLQGDHCLVRSAYLANGGSERLLPWVGELLAEAGLILAQLDGIAFGAGPGAFTGLRLACGVTQGLAFGADLPVVGICTLEAVAFNAATNASAGVSAERIFACLDARMNEVYVAAYVREAADVFHCTSEPTVMPPEMVAAPEGIWHAAGDGFAAYPVLQSRFSQADTTVLPTAAAVARLAAPRFLRGEGQVAASAAPLYVRDKVALTTAERLARGGVR